jgi:LPS sulfotransferase NodH
MIRGSVFRPQVTPFVIMFVERAGSTFLVTALKSHPDVMATTEKFDALRKEGKGAAEQLEWAREYLTPPLVGKHRAIGFKTKLVDVLDRDGFTALMRERKCKIIRLQRRNAVKAAISTINAKRQYDKAGYWNLLQESTRLPAFEVDPEWFDSLLREREALDSDLEQYVASLGLPTLTLVYEDLLQDRDAFVARVLEFIDVEAMPLEAATLKNTKDDLREAILNFDQLKAKYAGTKYEPMFDEVLATA